MPGSDLADRKWREIFEQQRILQSVADEGRAFVTAESINQTIRASLEQARTLCKIDYRQVLPRVMAENGLAILATTNGTYCIGHFDPFVDIPPSRFGRAVEKALPQGFVTLDAGAITSESRALDAALHSGMLEDVFGEEARLTLRGRTYSTEFALTLGSTRLSIRGVQMEVDGGYEGHEGIHLVEAKMNPLDNVSIRQVLYPMLHWRVVAAASRCHKEIHSYLLVYDSPWFKFTPFVSDGDSLAADAHGQRVFRLHEDRMLDLAAVEASAGPNRTDPIVPFPQANDMDKVLTMLTLIGSSDGSTRWELFIDFGMDIRQIDYYVGVLRWMRLCAKDNSESGNILRLTDEGRRVFSMSRIARLQEMAQIVFTDPIARAALRGTTDIENAALWENNGLMLSASTRHRRAQTIGKWVAYFRAVAGEQRHTTR